MLSLELPILQFPELFQHPINLKSISAYVTVIQLKVHFYAHLVSIACCFIAPFPYLDFQQICQFEVLNHMYVHHQNHMFRLFHLNTLNRFHLHFDILIHFALIILGYRNETMEAYFQLLGIFSL